MPALVGDAASSSFAPSLTLPRSRGRVREGDVAAGISPVLAMWITRRYRRPGRRFQTADGERRGSLKLVARAVRKPYGHAGNHSDDLPLSGKGSVGGGVGCDRTHARRDAPRRPLLCDREWAQWLRPRDAAISAQAAVPHADEERAAGTPRHPF